MISIVIPTYLQPTTGAKMLIVLLNSILKQKVSCQYEIIISDNDDSGEVKKISDQFWCAGLPILYFHNETKGASENFNNAFDMARGDKVKPMCMDDAFYTTSAIDTFDAMLDSYNWVISNSVHMKGDGSVYSSRITRYNHNQMDNNVTGMPSVIGFRKCDLRFDPKLKTFCDTFFYYQLYEKYGAPGVIKDFTVACRFWAGALSHNQPSHKASDLKYLRENKLIKC